MSARVRTTKCITENKTKVLRFIFAFFYPFSISHSNVLSEYGNFCQRFRRNDKAKDFEI